MRVVAEDQAQGSTAEIFDDIRRALGLANLHLYYPALAAYPAFLELHWKLLRGVVASQEFYACAERLRADSYTRTHNYFRIPPLFASDPRLEITAAVDFFHYRDPLLLLLFCAQLQALEGPTGQPKKAEAAPPALPAAERLELVAEEAAPPLVRGIYQDIRRTFGYPYVCPEFQALGRWPEFLRAYWSMLKQQLVQSALYDESRYAVRATAWSLAAELPGPLELPLDQLSEAGLPQDEIASVGRILDLFVNSLSGSLLNIAAAKVALEGGNRPARAAEQAEKAIRRDVA